MEPRDEKLYKLAIKRAKFRSHIFSYGVIIIFLWAIWWITSGNPPKLSGWPWPVWPTLGLLIALAFEYNEAFLSNTADRVDREYEKLKRRNQKTNDSDQII